MSSAILNFGSKAENLERLRPFISTAKILPAVYFTVSEWRTEADAIVGRVVHQLSARPLIVRSSARNEDGLTASRAGRYATVSDVSGEQAFRKAGETVIDSYGDAAPNDQILVQPKLSGVELSGVAFSCDPATLAPYRVVNYADGQDTAAGTGGRYVQSYVRAAGASSPIPQAPTGLFQLRA